MNFFTMNNPELLFNNYYSSIFVPFNVMNINEYSSIFVNIHEYMILNIQDKNLMGYPYACLKGGGKEYLFIFCLTLN